MKKFLLSTLLVICYISIFAQEASGPVISEVCGSGGTNGYRDFVELYNPTPNDISLEKWSIKYKSALGTIATGSYTFPTGAVIKGYGYLLIGFAGNGVLATDYNGTFDISGSSTTGGHIALCSPSTTEPDIWGRQKLEDLVAWGTGNTPERAAAPSHPALGGSLKRKASVSSTSATIAVGGADALKGNGYDTNDNSKDFVTKTISSPNNSGSPLRRPDYPIAFNDTFPNVKSITTQSFDITYNTNRDGKSYYVVVPDGEQAPSNEQIKVGMRFDGIAAIAGGSVDIVSAYTDYISMVTGLQSGTDYDLYTIAENYYGTIQAAPTKIEVKTEGTLPVLLTAFTAAYSKNGTISVMWRTASEKNNSHFIVQGSSDGKIWSNLRRTEARMGAVNGAEYQEELNWEGLSLAGLGIFGLLLIPCYNRRIRLVASIIFCSIFLFSCAKNADDLLVKTDLINSKTSNNQIYLRLAQVDKDGTISYSNVIIVKGL